MPAVSVIIPLYNAEKHIAACLDSILAQTFQNFEVIVVDDCSTDSSCNIVESYREKFGGRLILSHMNKNTGSGALPRNKGMILSCGEYIAFLDNDDMYTKTALEELYMLAKEYDADVVYCEKYYQTNANGSNRQVISYQSGDFVDKPTLEFEDLEQRVQAIKTTRYLMAPWCKLTRRSLIIEHEIFFPDTLSSDDDVWTYGLVFYAKKFLRIPNIINIRCLSEGSIMRTTRTPQQVMKFWLNPVLLGLKALNELMLKHEFFQKNPQYRYILLEMFVFNKFKACLQDSFKLPPFAVYETIEQAFGQQLGAQDVLIAALCTALNTQQKINSANMQQFQNFAAQAQARIAQLEAELKRRPI